MLHSLYLFVVHQLDFLAPVTIGFWTGHLFSENRRLRGLMKVQSDELNRLWKEKMPVAVPVTNPGSLADIRLHIVAAINESRAVGMRYKIEDKPNGFNIEFG